MGDPDLKPTLLIVDDDEAYAHALRGPLERDFAVVWRASADEAIVALQPAPDALLLDLRLEPGGSADASLSLLRRVRDECPSTAVVMCTAFGDVDSAVECMRLGAADFIQKGRTQLPELRARLLAALEHGRQARRLVELERELRLVEPRTIVGTSERMNELKRAIAEVAADGSISVLLSGPTGTGKELAARAIHASGPRSKGPYVAVALNALPAQTLVGELFGYEQGAFTSADKRHVGYIERAHRGVLFFDEIAETPLDVQAKLLRFLEEREFERLGSTRPIRVDVQIVSATHADLAALVEAGAFRADLYYRIKVHEIRVPGLRERTEDIPQLVDHFVRLLREQGKALDGVTPEAMRLLSGYAWPGNVRQLRNVVESAALQARTRNDRMIRPEDLPPEIGGAPPARAVRVRADHATGTNVEEALARTELDCVRQALEADPGGRDSIAKALGYRDRFALYRRVRRLIDKYPELAAAEFPAVVASFGKNRPADRDT